MKILAVETSCDDTGIAILECPKTGRPKILADLVSSQIKIHAPWGGVVPTLAKREHQRNLLPLLIQAFKKSNLLLPEQALRLRGASKAKYFIPFDSPARRSRSGNKIKTILDREPELLKKLLPFLEKYQKPNIDYIAVTIGPGLEPALWVGVNFARALSAYWNLPIIPINHIEGHIAAAFAADGKSRGTYNLQATTYKLLFPAICLVVSGGHTELFLMKKNGRYELLGETRDDAAGEAFDKAAKMLNLGYPGGPAIFRQAEKWKSQIPNPKSQINPKLQTTNYKLQTNLPRPMLNSGDFDFSFSGLKTALLYQLQKMSKKEIKEKTPAFCAEFPQAAVDVLVSKTVQAAKKFYAQTVLLAGGVAANVLLRKTLDEKLKKELPVVKFFSPAPRFCTDNAMMVGLAAWQKTQQKNFKMKDWQKISAQAKLRL